MNKDLLLMMLVQQAPQLLQALQIPLSHPGEWSDGEIPLESNLPHINELVDRGYDMGLVQDDMLKMYNDDVQRNLGSPQYNLNDYADIAIGNAFSKRMKNFHQISTRQQ